MSATVISFLQSLGLTTEQAQGLIKDDASLNIEDLRQQARRKVWDELKEHPEFGLKLLKQERAEVNGKWFSHVRKVFGLPEDEETAKKDMGELLMAGLKKQEETLKARYTVEGQTKVQEELVQLREAKAQLEDALRNMKENEIPKIKSQVERERETVRIENRIRDRILTKKMTTLPKDAVDVIFIPQLMNRLTKDYNLALDPKDHTNVILRDQKTNDLPYQANGNTLTIDDVIGQFARDLGIARTDDLNESGRLPTADAGTGKITTKGQAAITNMPYYQEAIERLEQLKANFKKD